MVSGGVLFISPWNQDGLLFIHSVHLGPDALWSFLTQFGEGGAALLLMIVAAQFCAGTSALVLKSFLLGSLLSPILKSLVASPRPLGVLDPQLLHIIGIPPQNANSMPSGHSMTIAVSISLALFMTRQTKHRMWLWPALIVWGVLVALSRVVVGAHWPADVLVGGGLGILIVLLAMAWEERRAWTPRLNTKPLQWVLLFMELGLVFYLFKAQTDTEAARWAFDLIATVGLAGAMNRWMQWRKSDI